MRFSVLLPTRDRLSYLRYAIESVLRQSVDDWEIVVADNNSRDDIPEYVASLADPRVRCLTSTEVLPVTANWNRALLASEGDYVVMLGDDDILLPHYFERLTQLIKDYPAAEAFYTGACLLAYPGVMPAQPAGYLQDYSYAEFFASSLGGRPFSLPPEVATRMVRHALNFRVRYGFNMQFALLARPLIERMSLRGPFFQSRFPDYYAMNALFLEAEHLVAWPQPCVLIGATPSSYGFFHATGRDATARAFLAGATEQPSDIDPDLLLPGSDINHGWLDAMLQLERRYPDKIPCQVNRSRYRWLQTLHVHEQVELRGRADAKWVGELEEQLNARLLPLSRLASAAFRPMRALSTRGAAAVADRIVPLLQFGQIPRPELTRVYGRYKNALEVFQKVESYGFDGLYV